MPGQLSGSQQQLHLMLLDPLDIHLHLHTLAVVTAPTVRASDQHPYHHSHHHHHEGGGEL